jgi:hypothetical protein
MTKKKAEHVSTSLETGVAQICGLNMRWNQETGQTRTLSMDLAHHRLEVDHSFMAGCGKWTWCKNHQSLQNHCGRFSAGVRLIRVS